MENSRQAVLDAAIQAFARKGYAGTSVDNILRATQLSKPTLYYYFESKAGLFRAILDFAYDECYRLMSEAAVRERECEARLVAAAIAFFQFAERHRDLMRLVFATVFAAPEEIPKNCIDLVKRRRNFELVLGIVIDAQKTGEIDPQYEAEEVAHGIFGALSHQVRMHLLMSKGRLNERRAQRVVALFLNGARTKK